VDNTHLDELFAPYPEHLNVTHLTEILGLGRTAVYRYLNEGILPAYKPGGQWLILKSEVRDYVASTSPAPREDEADAADTEEDAAN